MARSWVTIRGVKLMFIGAAAFWLPDVLLHAIRANSFASLDVALISAFMPLSLLLVLGLTRRLTRVDPLKHLVAIVAGIWLFGGFFMMLGASFSGGGFGSPQGIRWAIASIAFSLLPPYTFVLATYDGSLLALLLVTAIGMAALAIRSRGLMRNKGGEVRYNLKR